MLRIVAALALIPATLFASGKTVVVASFTIPADIVASVGGDVVSVTSVTPPNGDVHDLQPTPAQVRALTKADLVVALHPRFETWIGDLEKSGALKRPVLYLAPELEIEEEHEHAHAHHVADPHVWMDPSAVAKMGKTIAARLAALNADRAKELVAAGESHAARMEKLTADIRETLAPIPAPRRVIVCYHDNLSRFAKSFGFTVEGTLLDGPSTEASDPSAKRLSALLNRIREKKVPALFTDNTIAKELPAAVAREAGLPPPVTLYVDALDRPGTPAGTYEGMMRENARRIAAALK